MKKTYKTLASSGVIQVSTSRGVRQIYFRPGFVDRGSLRGGVYTTEDEEIQKGIESHKRFKSGFYDEIWTDDVEAKAKTDVKVKDAPKKEETPVVGSEKETEAKVVEKTAEPTNEARKEFPEVTKMAEVRAILKENYGKTATEVKSNAQVLALINELGLVFPNLK